MTTLKTNSTGDDKVDGAHVATLGEFNDYLSRLASWRSALREYCNMFDTSAVGNLLSTALLSQADAAYALCVIVKPVELPHGKAMR
ncbi:MAG: hypothetical protein IH600_15610 [Bacteroidetes bacterium]|nr:hypothetical protein [Bacteroidota bacterium]